MSRAINWVSALDRNSQSLLEDLQNKMVDFYSNSQTYYEDIDFNYNIWEDLSMLPQQDITRALPGAQSVLEIGCGKANILAKNRELENRYCGIDFSPELIKENEKKYAGAGFKTIDDPKRFPYPDETFDVVFSHFVIEHTIYPHFFIDECIRLLKPGGTLMILCPDFLSNNGITSQRVGLSQGAGGSKLKKGKIVDAFLTWIDNKIRLPYSCSKKRKLADLSPQFYINLTPTCFTDTFLPDVDAVYITYKNEMKKYAGNSVNWIDLPNSLNEYCKKYKLIYLKGIRNNKN